VPFWLIWAMAGRRAMVQVWPACLTAGASFGASHTTEQSTLPTCQPSARTKAAA